MENPLQTPSDCSIDLLSNLPDDILGKILSFLPLKMAVGTSVLSTRWKDLWARDLSVLDFDNTLYLSGRRPTEEGEKLFRDFVVRVLNLSMTRSSSRLIKFRYHYEHWIDLCIIPYWYCRLPDDIWKRVMELDLTMRSKKYFTIENKLFTCANLVSLKIDARFLLVIAPEWRVHLPNVKVVHLHSVIPQTDSSIPRLLKGCPVLEELVISKLDMIMAQKVNIHSSKLKRLKINSCPDLEVDTPNLEYLEVNGFGLKDLTVKQLPSLTKAKICACQDSDDAFELLARISQVKSLTLGIHTVEELCESSHYLYPTFHNLLRLEIFLYEHENTWRVMHGLLEKSPILEVLIIDCYFLSSDSEDSRSWLWPEAAPSEFLERLRTLEVRSYGKQENVENLIQYIRQNAEALNSVLIAHEGL